MSLENPFETVAPDTENITSEETDTDREEYKRLEKMLSLKGQFIHTEDALKFKELSEEEQEKIRARYEELKGKLGYGSLKSGFLKGK